MLVSTATLILLLSPGISCYPAFYIRIPNGDKVPHVCPPPSPDPSIYRWPAVGHWLSKGGDGSKFSLNPFGKDFAANNFRWTRELCKKDSDADGKTNGEELGDPQCLWSMESLQAPVGNATSHPGVCEPLSAKKCLHVNPPLAKECPYHVVAYSVEEEKPEDKKIICPALKSPNTKTFELRLKGGSAEVSIVNENEFVHFCQTFTLPSDEEYHIVAFEPTTSRDDAFFIKHVILHACVNNNDEFNLAAAGGLNTPSKTACQLMKPCGRLIGSWEFSTKRSSSIFCLSPLVGIRFGEGHFTKIVADFYFAFKWDHPNNSESAVDVSDSGIKLYYTAHLRRFDMGTLVMGESFIKIPPGQPSYNVAAVLTNRCLRDLATKESLITPIYSSIFVNQFYQKAKFSIIPPRSSMPGQELGRADREVSIESPFYSTGIKNTLLRTVDGLRMDCQYDSGDNEEFTFYGPPPKGEFCHASLNFYPADNTTWFIDATQMGDISICLNSDIVKGCPIENFSKKYKDSIFRLKEACRSSTYPPTVCPPDCKTLIVRQELLGHECLVGDVFQKLVRTPSLLRSNVVFSPFEASSVAGTIDLCRIEVYTIVIEKAGLNNRLNKSLDSEYMENDMAKCFSSKTFSQNYLTLFFQVIIFTWNYLYNN